MRGWSADRLAALLRARPDLAIPAPTDSAQLAARATSRASIWRAFELCDAAERSIIEAVSSIEGLTPPAVAPLIGADTTLVERIVARLGDLLLLWDDGSGLRVPRPLAEHCAIPMGPPLSTIPGLIGELTPPQAAMLKHLVEGQFDGTSATGPGSTAGVLLALGLLGARGGGEPSQARQQRLTVTITTRQHFFAGRITNQPPTAPDIATAVSPQHTLDQIGAGSASALLRQVEAIAEAWGRRPPIALKSGDVAARDLKALCKSLTLDPHRAGFLLEVMDSAHLIASRDFEHNGQEHEGWMPTTGYDEWSRWPTSARWAYLAQAWLGMARRPALTATRSSSGSINALSPEIAHPHIAALRGHLLETWATTQQDTRLAAGTGMASLLTALHWRHPQWYYVDEMALEVITEAAWLGLVVNDGLTTTARELIGAGMNAAAAALEPLLPDPVDHVLVQADLTAIAPGPLEIDLAMHLAEVADVDSRGGATVYRFTTDSIRRGLDAGRSAEEIKGFLREASRTPIPQALDYLIDDVARRFGALRLGAASVFLRSDDEVAITELLHDPRVTTLNLRRIAPTVLISDLEPSAVLERLREIGAAPVVEAADGTVRVARPDVHRAVMGRLNRAQGDAALQARVAATVAAIQSGDRASVARPANTVAYATHDIIALLRRTLDANAEIVLAYAGSDGTVSQRVVRPLRLEGGRLTAFDERSDLQREFVVHRITAASPAAP